MLPIRGSAAESAPVEHFRPASREPGEDNVGWLSRQYDELRQDDDTGTFLILVGGTGIYDFRLRVAQSHLRHDMTPSHWSHAAVIAQPARSFGRSLLLESSLEPVEGFGLPSRYNGIQGALLSRYADPGRYPNLALIRVPVAPATWRSSQGDVGPILAQLSRQRASADVPSLIVEWLGFVWGAGVDGNPLLRAHGIPAAVVIETLLGAAGYDLCPGVDSAASCPEAFWQTAKWWTQYLHALNLDPLTTRYLVAGEDAAVPASTGALRESAPAPAPGWRGPTLPESRLTARLFRD